MCIKKSHIALYKVLLIPEETVTASSNRNDTYLAAATELVATANHPVLTDEGKKAIGNLKAGDVLYHFNQMTH